MNQSRRDLLAILYIYIYSPLPGQNLPRQQADCSCHNRAEEISKIL
ncbi:MAG: hypothetical protein GX188_06835 [Syntrophomonadaceae bacterium]|nr:hypothetical protein [Syntrophomonadaceae bacterium]